MLDLKLSPYVLVLGMYGWVASLLMLPSLLYTDSLSNTITLARHTLPSEVSVQGHCLCNPDPYCHVAPATQLQMSVSVGLHSNQPS